MLVVETDAEADAEVKVGRLGLGAADELEADKVDKDHGGDGSLYSTWSLLRQVIGAGLIIKCSENDGSRT